MQQQDYDNIDEYFGDNTVKYYNYDEFYVNMDKLVEHEDSEDYFDNTMDMLDRMDSIVLEIDNKVSFTLEELCNIDEDLIYHVGKKDGMKYVSDLIDHIYSDGYKGE
jgi:hypothetical protein